MTVLKQVTVHLQTKSVVVCIMHSFHFPSGPPAWRKVKLADALLLASKPSIQVVYFLRFLQQGWALAHSPAHHVNKPSPAVLLVLGTRETSLWEGSPNAAIINRPSVAGAVLQSPPLLINSLNNWFIHPLVQISSKHCQSQTGRARELKFWENVHPTLCVMCHVSCVMCHVSPVTFHLSPIPFYILIFF